MKTSATIFLAGVALVSSSFIGSPRPQIDVVRQKSISNLKQQKYLLELAPGRTQWVTEEEKYDLIARDVNFMDITDYQDPPANVRFVDTIKVKYPAAIANSTSIKTLLPKIQEKPMRDNLSKFSSFYNRFYSSPYGKNSSEWLLRRVQDTIKESGAEKYGVYAKAFVHKWGQNSVIAKVPGKTNVTIVIGAHQDSINQRNRSGRAPGADDDGSGVVTILEALRVLLMDDTVKQGKAPNTVEFQFYSAEEVGLLGSQAIFRSYKAEGRDVRAMFQQDMTGYVKKTLAAGKKEALGLITDFVDRDLTLFAEKVGKAYCNIPIVRTKCNYACSDHASANKVGYPSAFVIESEFRYTNPNIHSEKDTIAECNFPHMVQHAKLTLGLAYELAFADLPKKSG